LHELADWDESSNIEEVDAWEKGIWEAEEDPLQYILGLERFIS
jgi:hypothetical protein